MSILGKGLAKQQLRCLFSCRQQGAIMVESRSISHSVQPVLTCVSPAQQLGGACDLSLNRVSGLRGLVCHFCMLKRLSCWRISPVIIIGDRCWW